MFTFSLLEAATSTVLGNVIVVSGAFLLLIFLLKKFAWKQITSVFENRAKKINDDIDAAEEAHKTAAVLVAKRENELAGSQAEAATIIETATTTAEQTRDKIVADAHADADATKKRAALDIAQERKEAMGSVKSDVASISVQIAEKLIAGSLDVRAHQALIDSYLEKLGD
ncbi:MAG: F0F1 ATP synthase subunit B [Streptococcaceae bacterium]|jgi:F-type H+-transporting ATPase subunit b|nr:F0F1 ATP synthase subunit B [Streptococcaceae bacterium]